MNAVALGRTRAAVAPRTGIVDDLDGPGRKLRAGGFSRTRGQTVGGGGQVEHRPVPPPALARCIGIVQGDDEALGTRGRRALAQLRRTVPPIAACCIVDQANGGHGAIADVRTGKREHGSGVVRIEGMNRNVR